MYYILLLIFYPCAKQCFVFFYFFRVLCFRDSCSCVCLFNDICLTGDPVQSDEEGLVAILAVVVIVRIIYVCGLFIPSGYIRDSATGEWRQTYSKYHRFGIQVLTTIVVLFYLSISVGCVFAAIYLRDDHHIDLFAVASRDRCNRNDDHGDIATAVKIISGVINGITVFIFDQIFEKLAGYLNIVENHRTDYSYQTCLIIKTSLFELIFVNSFASLFYLAFYRPRVFPNIYLQYGSKREEDVQLQLLILFLIQILLERFFEIAISGCKKNYRKSKTCVDIAQKAIAVNKAASAGREGGGAGGAGGAANKTTAQSKSAQFNSFINGLSPHEQAILKDTYESTLCDISEMVIQCGYINLLVLCFPLTPLLALINNIIEMKIDGLMLPYDTKRLIPIKSYGIGVSIKCLGLIAIISVFTNVPLVTFRTESVYKISFDVLHITAQPEKEGINIEYSFFIFICCILVVVLGYFHQQIMVTLRLFGTLFDGFDTKSGILAKFEGVVGEDDSSGGATTTEEDDLCDSGAGERTSGGSFDVTYYDWRSSITPDHKKFFKKMKYQRVYNVDLIKYSTINYFNVVIECMNCVNFKI